MKSFGNYVCLKEESRVVTTNSGIILNDDKKVYVVVHGEGLPEGAEVVLVG